MEYVVYVDNIELAIIQNKGAAEVFIKALRTDMHVTHGRIKLEARVRK